MFTSIQMKIVGMEANAKLYLMYPHEDWSLLPHEERRLKFFSVCMGLILMYGFILISSQIKLIQECF